MTTGVRIRLPQHLRDLAQVEGEVQVDVDGAVTQRSVLDALEAAFPPLRGTIRDHTTKRRRPFIRFFVGEDDHSHDDPDDALPPQVADGREPFQVIGAMAGG